jgi:hypothetical protein
MGYGLDGPGLILRSGTFFSLPERPGHHWGSPNLLFN